MSRVKIALRPMNHASKISRRHVGSSSTLTGSKGSFDQVVFSGIQPTGTPHLGNYLGLFLPFLDLQRSCPTSIPIYLSIVGLHAITLPRDPQTLLQDRKDMLAALVACGVDVDRTCLFFQEDIPEHAELAWILNTLTPVGRLQRMTTWKSQLATLSSSSVDDISESDLKLGLLAYPVLQAADIMLYKSTVVPVGEDQKQHIELARSIAETFNRMYGEIFPLPTPSIVPSKRILNLRDPTSKMSKSAPGPNTRILLTDPPSTVFSKIKSAVTDSEPSITFDPQLRPGVANLLTIWSALEGITPEDAAEQAMNQGWRMGKLKEVVADVVVEKLRPVREEYERVRKEDVWLGDITAKGRTKASENAKKTMDQVRRVLGLGRI